jgi:hypothetical protein
VGAPAGPFHRRHPRFVNLADGSPRPEQFDATAQFLRAALLFELDADLTSTVERLLSVALSVPGEGKAVPYSADALPSASSPTTLNHEVGIASASRSRPCNVEAGGASARA